MLCLCIMVKKRELTVKRDTYGEKDAVAIETWEDVTLFKVRGLNHLHISGFPQMTSISPQITQLNSLLELILIENGLQSLPEEIGTLTRLRLLDASSNAINQLPTATHFQFLYVISCRRLTRASHANYMGITLYHNLK